MLPYLYQSDSLTIGSYGVMLALAYLIGRWYFLKQLARHNLQGNRFEILVMMLLVAGVIGAKLMFVLKNPERAAAEGGLLSASGFSSQGAILGALVVTLLFAHYAKVALHQLLDAAAPAAILAYAVARVGCFLAGDDCYGVTSDLPWAVAFPDGIAPTHNKVHPLPLYEIAYSLAIFVFLHQRSRKPYPPYFLFFSLLLSWGFCRFWIEFISINPIKIWGMTGSQFGALLMFISASIYFLWAKLRQTS